MILMPAHARDFIYFFNYFKFFYPNLTERPSTQTPLSTSKPLVRMRSSY